MRDCFEQLLDPITCGYKRLDHIWTMGINDISDSEIPKIPFNPESMIDGVRAALESFGSDHLPITTTIKIGDTGKSVEN